MMTPDEDQYVLELIKRVRPFYPELADQLEARRREGRAEFADVLRESQETYRAAGNDELAIRVAMGLELHELETDHPDLAAAFEDE
jgi:hypothetical protein